MRGAALFVVAATIVWGGAAAHADGVDTGVVNVSHSRDYSEGEEPLSVSPTNPAQMTAVANVFQVAVPGPLQLVFGGSGVQDTRVYSTGDGGQTWTAHKLDVGGIGPVPNPLPPSLGFAPEFSDAFNIINSDADSVWDRAGNVYFESGDIHGINHGGDEQATVWRSTDGGRTWGPKNGYTAVSARQEASELDRPWFAADTSGGPHDGRLYMSFETTPFATIPPQVYLKHSDDQGRTWSPTVRVDDGTYETQWNPRARPVVGAGGDLYVVYDRAAISVTPFTDQGSQPIALAVARSSDGGQNFTRAIADDAVHRVTSPDEATPQYTEMIAAIAADPVRRGRVAIAWPEATGAGSSRIVLRSSVDGGVHWSRRVDVADDPPTMVNQHDHVTLAWAPDGRLYVGWRDRRCCGGSFASDWEQRVRVLTFDAQGRAVPGTTVVFTDKPQAAATASARGALEPDEFQGLVATSIGVGLTWSQRVGAFDDLMFRRVPLAAFAPCADRRRLVLELGGLPGQRLVRATLYVDGRLRTRLRGRRLRRIALGTLSAQPHVVRIVAVTARGDRVITTRHYRDCQQTGPATVVVRRRHRTG